MSSSLMTAVVELRPNLEGFRREAIQGVGRAADQAGDRMEKQLAEAGKRAGRKVGDGIESGTADGLRRGAEGHLADNRGRFSKAGRDLGDAFGRGFDEKAKSISARLSSVGSSMMKSGALMTAGLTAPIALMGKSAAEAAIAYEDAQAANEVLWGKQGKAAIDAWAKSHSDALNLSRTTVSEMTQGFSGYLTKLGTQGPAELTKLMGRLADSRSFFGGRIEDKTMAVSAALRGEFDSLETAFPGVAMSMERVVTKANQLYGIHAKTTSELSDQQRIQATLVLFYEQTAAAAGDVERTAGSTANKLEDAKEKWDEMKLTLGQKLLPVIGELAPKIAAVIKRLSDRGVFDRLIPAVEKLATALGDVLDAFSKLPSGVQTAVIGFAAFGGPILTLVGGLTSIVGAASKAVLALKGVQAASAAASAASAAGGAGAGAAAGGAGATGAVAAGAGVTGAVAAGLAIGYAGFRGLEWIDRRTGGHAGLSRDRAWWKRHGLPGMADGGHVVRPGLSWVGEEGPELLNLPKGATVTPLGQAGTTTITNHVSIQGANLTAADVARELDRISRDAAAATLRTRRYR